MTPHPRYQYQLVELFLTVFVHLDDWLKPYQKPLPQQPTQEASHSELQGRTRPVESVFRTFLSSDYCSRSQDPRSTQGRIRWI